MKNYLLTNQMFLYIFPSSKYLFSRIKLFLENKCPQGVEIEKKI